MDKRVAEEGLGPEGEGMAFALEQQEIMAEKAAEEASGEQDGFLWYVIHVAAGGENRIAQELRAQLEKAGLSESFTDILIPKKQEMVVRKGAKVLMENRVLPGYILIRMRCSSEMLHIIRRVPRIIGMLGADGGGIPRALSEGEVKNLLDQVNRIEESSKGSMMFEKGEMVKISDGPFSSMEGIVEAVDLARLRLKVSIVIFGRGTPVELEFFQVEKTT